MPAARVEQKNGMTKEDKNGVIPPLTKKAPYKPDAGDPHVRFDERGWKTERLPQAQATASILDSTHGGRHRPGNKMLCDGNPAANVAGGKSPGLCFVL
jgi:hypothetical protein